MIQIFIFMAAALVSFVIAPATLAQDPTAAVLETTDATATLTESTLVAQYDEEIPAEDFWDNSSSSINEDNSSYEDDTYYEEDTSYEDYYHSEVEVFDDPWSIEDELEYEASQEGYSEDEEATYYDHQIEELY